MQFPKELIRKDIIDAARKDFERFGFEKASIRNITAEAKTSKSNFYNYFADKDSLFRAIVEETRECMMERIREIRTEKGSPNGQKYSIEAQRDAIRAVMEYIYNREADFILLFFRSAGSSLSSFKDELAEALADVLQDWMGAVSQRGQGVSRFFIRSVAGFYVDSIMRLLREGKTKREAAAHLDEFLKFVYGGWSGLL